MTSASVVRPATPHDEIELWRMMRLHWAENALFPMSEHKVKFYLDRILHPEWIGAEDTGPRGLAGVIGPSHSLEGAIILILGSPWYSDAVNMDDCMNFVDPKHRHSDHAKVLISYSKYLVDQIRQGHPTFKMVLGVVSTERTAAKVRLYSRYLEEPVGAYFMYPRGDDVKPLKNMHRIN